tara:strand:- start:6 stop:362 length:357 start_codon:yes stop_codon:yes gene_type:complete
MIWPPVKAWTSNRSIEGQVHFVAINYGGKLPDRWVILMSVIDSNVIVKVSWSKLVDLSKWECGWNEKNHSNYSKVVNNKSEISTTKIDNPSEDSGLTIPITKKNIRPWFSTNQFSSKI